MKNTHDRIWNMARNFEKGENEKCSLQDLEYGQKTEEMLKMRDTHFRTCNMASKLTSEENENLTWQDLEYGKKH